MRVAPFRSLTGLNKMSDLWSAGQFTATGGTSITRPALMHTSTHIHELQYHGYCNSDIYNGDHSRTNVPSQIRRWGGSGWTVWGEFVGAASVLSPRLREWRGKRYPPPPHISDMARKVILTESWYALLCIHNLRGCCTRSISSPRSCVLLARHTVTSGELLVKADRTVM